MLMVPILHLIFRYILIGITTAVGVLIDTPSELPPLASHEYQQPTQALPFLFEDAPDQPIQISPAAEAPRKKAEPPQAPQPPLPSSQPKSPETPVPLPKPKEHAPDTPPSPAPLPKSEIPLVHSAKDAVVNIICVETLGNLTRTTTGSGSIISPKGIILTNAHVAVDLMKPNNVCTIRTGNRATHAYKATLYYIPDEWIKRNQDYISSGVSRATTGEHDFALLQISSSATSVKLPERFPYIKLNNKAISVGDDIEVVGYPAERFALFSSHSDLYRISDDTEVKRIYSFGETSTDVISTGKVSNAEHGSSGGAIIKDGQLIGVIANINNGTINALSIGYIASYFEDDTDLSFSSVGK